MAIYRRTNNGNPIVEKQKQAILQALEEAEQAVGAKTGYSHQYLVYITQSTSKITTDALYDLIATGDVEYRGGFYYRIQK